MTVLRTSRQRCAAFGAAVLLVSTAAWAKPQVEIRIDAFKQVVETAKDGKKTTRRVAAKDAQPGDVVEYAVTYANRGDEPATDAVVDDPIPAGTVYVAGSAVGDGADIGFSVDGGKSFGKPEQLTTAVQLPGGKTERRAATPAEYTHVRWTVKRVPPGASGTLGFKVKVK